MNSLTQDFPALLLPDREAPCLSLYQPTHKRHPENSQDTIRFGNLLKRLTASLHEKYPAHDIEALMRPFEALAKDHDFWNHAGEGLAVLGATDFFRVYRLARPVTELAVVADSFHLKPLMRIVQSADRYQILGLNQHAFRIFEGNRDSIAELPPIAAMPQTIDAILGQDDADSQAAHRNYGAAGAIAVPGQGAAVAGGASGRTGHGVDVKQDADDRDREHFFRAVDAAVLKHCSQPSGLGLILAALPQHHHLFRSLSINPALLDVAIDVDPDSLSLDALRELAWQVVQPHYLKRLAELVESYGTASSHGRGAGDLSGVAEAAVAGRVKTLLIEADRLQPGRIDPKSGQITNADLDNPAVDDVFDDLGELVLRKGGEVIIVPAERMPTRTGAAAIYRY